MSTSSCGVSASFLLGTRCLLANRAAFSREPTALHVSTRVQSGADLFDVSRHLSASPDSFSDLIHSGSISQVPSRWGWEAGGGTQAQDALVTCSKQRLLGGVGRQESRLLRGRVRSDAVQLSVFTAPSPPGRRYTRDRQPRDWLCLHHGWFGVCLGKSPVPPQLLTSQGHPALGWACRGSPSSSALWGCC